MLLSSLNTGSTDLRDTEVQQPNTTATLSLEMSSRAFSAKSGQFEAGSTTTGSSFLPSKPPFLFCSSIIISTVSFSVVSLMAMVPESECKTPTLIVSCALERLAQTTARRNDDATNDLRVCLIHPPSNVSVVLSEELRKLELQSNSCLPRVRSHRIKVSVPVKTHQASVKLLDDVVQIYFSRILSITRIWAAAYRPVSEFR